MKNNILVGHTATVLFGCLEIEGIETTCGKYFVAIPQLASRDLIPANRSAKELKTYLCIDFQVHKIKTNLHPSAVNCVEEFDFVRIIKASAKKGNENADLLLDALIGVSVHQAFCDAFNKKFEKEERQEFYKVRLEGKLKRRSLTDAIKDYVARHMIDDPYIYAKVSDTVNQTVLGHRAKDARDLLHLSATGAIRDHLSANALEEIKQLETVIQRYIDEDDMNPVVATQKAILVTKAKKVGL